MSNIEPRPPLPSSPFPPPRTSSRSTPPRTPPRTPCAARQARTSGSLRPRACPAPPCLPTTSSAAAETRCLTSLMAGTLGAAGEARACYCRALGGIHSRWGWWRPNQPGPRVMGVHQEVPVGCCSCQSPQSWPPNQARMCWFLLVLGGRLGGVC